MIPTYQSVQSVLPQSTTLFAVMPTQPTAARKVLINNTIAALISAGIWQLCDLIYFFAVAAQDQAVFNWKTPGTNTLTENATPTFTANAGYTGNAVDMSLTASYTNALYLQDNCHIAAFGLTNTATAISDFVITNVTPAGRGQVRTRNSVAGLISAGAGTATLSTIADMAPRMLAGDRSDSANQSVYSNGVFDVTAAVASLAVVATNVTFLANGIGGFSDRQIAFGSCGSSLSATQHASLNSIVRGYLTGVGAI